MAETNIWSVGDSGKTHTLPVAGFAVWSWSEARSHWALVTDRSAAGYEPGGGPTQFGRFDGHTVRWESVPNR